MLSEDESPVGSSGDDGAFARPPLRHDLVVSIVADDDFNVQRLSAATAAAVRRLGGPPDAAGLHVLGNAHLRWVLVDSALVSNDRSWAREISSLRRSTSLVTHWLDYAVIAGSWFDTVASVYDFVSDKHERVMDLRVLGTFRMWGPLARCIRQGHIRYSLGYECACESEHNQETCRCPLPSPHVSYYCWITCTRSITAQADQLQFRGGREQDGFHVSLQYCEVHYIDSALAQLAEGERGSC
jgi:hypothetical protein